MIFRTLMGTPRAASPENPRFSLQDPTAWDDILTPKSSSGVAVSRESALTYAPWWRGVNLLSGGAAKLPLLTYRLEGDRRRIEPGHPAYALLRHKPNEYMTAGTWKRLMVAHAIQTGNGYSIIERRGDATPTALLPVDPEHVTPCREGGRLVYVVRIVYDNGAIRSVKILAENMFHVKGLSYDGLHGYSVYDRARESLGLGMAMTKYGSVFFRNQARPNVAIEVPGKLNETQVQSLREQWQRMGEGLDNSHRLAVLQGGSKLTPFQINARDAQLIESRAFQLRDIALWLGVPPHKLGADAMTSYGSLEQENQSYLDEGLDPWLCAIEEEAHDKLCTEEEKASDEVEMEFDRSKLIRASMNDRANYFARATNGKPWMLRNEVRMEEGLNPVDGWDEEDTEPPAPAAPVVPETEDPAKAA